MFFMEVIEASVKLMYAFESPKLDLYNSSYDPFSRTATGCPVLTIHTVQILGLIFDWEKEGIWAIILHRNCSCISELDVRLLNHPN